MEENTYFNINKVLDIYLEKYLENFFIKYYLENKKRIFRNK
jgi:hypothetical protein